MKFIRVYIACLVVAAIAGLTVGMAPRGIVTARLADEARAEQPVAGVALAPPTETPSDDAALPSAIVDDAGPSPDASAASDDAEILLVASVAPGTITARITGVRPVYDDEGETVAVPVAAQAQPSTALQPIDAGHDLSGFHACDCEQCPSQIVDEKLVPDPNKKRMVCIYVYEPKEVTVPYCKVKCENGECTEIVGTKTVRRFVRRVKEVEVELLDWIAVPDTPVQKRVRCGYEVTNCPKPKNDSPCP